MKTFEINGDCVNVANGICKANANNGTFDMFTILQDIPTNQYEHQIAMWKREKKKDEEKAKMHA
jgi:hypothetical protein